MFCFCFGELDQALAAEPSQGGPAPGALAALLVWAHGVRHCGIRTGFYPCESEVALAAREAQPWALEKGGDGAVAGEAAARLGVFEMEHGADVRGDVLGLPVARSGEAGKEAGFHVADAFLDGAVVAGASVGAVQGQDAGVSEQGFHGVVVEDAAVVALEEQGSALLGKELAQMLGNGWAMELGGDQGWQAQAAGEVLDGDEVKFAAGLVGDMLGGIDRPGGVGLEPCESLPSETALALLAGTFHMDKGVELAA